MPRGALAAADAPKKAKTPSWQSALSETSSCFRLPETRNNERFVCAPATHPLAPEEG